MSISKVSGGKVDVHLWLPIHEVESSALSQLKNIASLPWVFSHVAAMPDCHLGKGATVGSVIAMKNAVSPSAVGVDIGCLDSETEFLSPNGWVKMSEWNGHQVMSYDPATDKARFCVPREYINLPCSEFFHFKNSKGMDQMLSEEHRALVFHGHKSRGYDYSVLRPDELAEKPLSKGYYTTKACFHVDLPDLSIDDEMIRIDVMVQADGRVRKTSRGNRVELHLRRPRKIKRALKLLDDAVIDYTVSVEASGSTRIAFTLPPDFGNKDLSRYYLASERQLLIIAEEALLWDGHVGYRSFYSTTDIASRDLIQYAFTATGTRAGISSAGKQAEHHSECFVVTPTKNPMVGYCQPVKVASKDGRKYCFTVDTSFFVARRGGKIFTTGNCGMLASKTNLKAPDLPDNLKPLRLAIEDAVPVGFSEHKSPVAGVMNLQLWKDFCNLHPKVKKLKGKAGAQCGSLGGGNHYIEVCLDTSDNVWLMLHSGSRNIGKTLAEIHIEKARQLAHNQALPDKDLAVFLSGTREMNDYRHDLFWAQKYALENRHTMFRLIKDVMLKFFPQVKFEQPIQCHHNYLSEERHFGEDVLVTRKGAIYAGLGAMGIIPGSMGTKSYIVRGLGNAESFTSASHGAGRRMSRGEAKRKFRREDLLKQTHGVECRKDNGVLDEIPGAYKDIDVVMSNQQDLVEIVACLKQIICVKG